jgi:hypothetical protein
MLGDNLILVGALEAATGYGCTKSIQLHSEGRWQYEEIQFRADAG